MLLMKALSSPSARITGCVKSGRFDFHFPVLDFVDHHQSVLSSLDRLYIPL